MQQPAAPFTQSTMRDSLKALQQERSKISSSQDSQKTESFLSRLRSKFSRQEPPALPLPNNAQPTKGTSLWGLFGSAQQPSWFEHFGLGVTQRWLACTVFLLVGFFLFSFSLMNLFSLSAVFSPTKFAIPFCLSSLFFLTAVGFVRGMKSHLASFFQRERLLYSGLYLSATLVTLVLAFSGASYLVVLLCVIFQLATLLWNLLSFVPGGNAGISNASRVVFSSFISRF